jgi:DnaJ domain
LATVSQKQACRPIRPFYRDLRYESCCGGFGSSALRERIPPGRECFRALLFPSFEDEPHSLGILRRDDSLATVLKTLGVVEAAGAEEISAAYRKLAQIHHPDKVTKLKPEVKEYSEQKMKEINAAYALLRNQGDGSASSRG